MNSAKGISAPEDGFWHVQRTHAGQAGLFKKVILWSFCNVWGLPGTLALPILSDTWHTFQLHFYFYGCQTWQTMFELPEFQFPKAARF